MKKFLFIGLVLAVLFSGCIIPPDPKPFETPIEFDSIERESMSAIKEKTHYVINTQEDFEELYSKIHLFECAGENAECGSIALPEVNFDKQTVIAVFMGEQTYGHRLEIAKVTKVKQSDGMVYIKVYAKEIQKISDPNTGYPAVMLQPYEIISIEKTKASVKVVREFIKEYPDNLEDCAGLGEKYSGVYEDYPDECCAGLTKWPSGMDTRISVAGNCYETGKVAGSPVGTCIACGDGVCSKLEDVCNCPKDCVGGKNSDYKTLEEFCFSSEWAGMQPHCNEDTLIKDLCSICDYKIFPVTTTISELKKLNPSTGVFQLSGYVVNIYDCPPCPEGAICEPCDMPNIIISENKEMGDYVGLYELKVYNENSSEFELNHTYTFIVKIRAGKDPEEELDSVELIGYKEYVVDPDFPVELDGSKFLDQYCDAINPCPADYECASFPEVGLKCYPTTTTSNPCDFVKCSSGKECIVAESYPVQIFCS